MADTQPRITVPYFNKHRHKIILAQGVAKAVRLLTGRNTFNDTDKEALELLGVKLVHIDEITKSLNK